jgi:hypothetical protein
MPTDKLNSLSHFAQPNVLTRTGLVEHRQWLEATAPILQFQADRSHLTLKRKPCPCRARVLTHIGERLLCNPEESRFDRWR